MHVLASPSMMSRASRPLSLMVPPEIFRLVTKARMSFSEALVLRGISGRSRTRSNEVGFRPIEIQPGKSAVAVKSLEELHQVIDILIQAVKEGQLDQQLAAVAK